MSPQAPSPFWEKSRHADRRPFLLARAALLRAVRDWFDAQGFIEADVGALVASPGAETHISAFETRGGYLHASPEFAMKKLLAAGEEKVFFLGKCYRAGEQGPLHAPEFTMLEWYRAGAPYAIVMDDCVALTRLAAEVCGASAFFWQGKACNPFKEAQRLSVAEAFQFHVPSLQPEGDSDAFSAALVKHIEPNLGSPALTLLDEYPISEAALARRCAHDANIAERFELYTCGVELANGFGELTDPVEQRARLQEAMAQKLRCYGVQWPIDEDFLAALAHMPPASGVALGFDRLVMLASGATKLQDVLWTPR